MMRIKIPFGGLTADQLDVLADLGEEYSDSICHITTRQDVQLHYIHIQDTVDLMRRLAATGVTTREACGNSVRNVTACPLSGVCSTEAFDVTPYAQALTKFLLGHPDCQDFGRKFKIAFSGCRHEACGLVYMHDMGALAVTRTIDGVETRGFELYVGGGPRRGPTPGQTLRRFSAGVGAVADSAGDCPGVRPAGRKEESRPCTGEIPDSQAGNRGVQATRSRGTQGTPEDPAWTAYLEELPAFGEEALHPSQPLNGVDLPAGFDEWSTTNVRAQSQPGYVVVTINLPLGDITSDALRALAATSRRYVKDTIRATVDQNLVLRWVSEADLPALYGDLKEINLADPCAGTIVDVTACPGTDTCKLGIASSRGLAAELRHRLAAQYHELDQAVKDLRIKISGCFNSCGQHHAADIGFYGISRRSTASRYRTSR